MTTSVSSCHFCLLTPRGPSAIAVTSLFGPNAQDIIERHFRGVRGATVFEPGKFRYGTWTGTTETSADSPKSESQTGNSNPCEDLLVSCLNGDEFEIHSHGGNIASSLIARDLIRAGVEEISWQQYFLAHRRWFEAWPLVLAQSATTERTAILLSIQQRVWLDLARQFNSIDTVDKLSSATKLLEEINRWYRYGIQLTQPRKIAIFGPPNAGKSSLLNSLVGFSRSIVHETAGTTRDVVSMNSAIGGWPVVLIDTAGMRESEEEVESAGVRFAKEAVSSSDIRILLLDSADQPDDKAMNELLNLEPDIVVWNKSDHAGSKPPATSHSSISVKTGAGMSELKTRLANLLDGPELPDPILPVPLSGQMMEMLFKAIVTGKAEMLEDFVGIFCPHQRA